MANFGHTNTILLLCCFCLSSFFVSSKKMCFDLSSKKWATYVILKLEVGMTRFGTDTTSCFWDPVCPVVCYMGCAWPATVKEFYFMFGLARVRLYRLWAEYPFFLFFSLDLLLFHKNNTKHRAASRRPGPSCVDKIWKFWFAITLSLRGKPVNKPDPIHVQVYLKSSQNQTNINVYLLLGEHKHIFFLADITLRLLRAFLLLHHILFGLFTLL